MSRSVLSVAVAVAAVFLTVSGAYAQVKSAPPPPKSAPAAQAKGAAAAATFKDSRDGKTYKTMKADGKTWMAENLNFAEKGSACPENKDENCAKYGRLYDWATANKACPAGWHLANNDDWKSLEKHAGGGQTAGKKLKAAKGWGNTGSGSSGNGTDEFGFAALPGGIVQGDIGKFSAVEGPNASTAWWSATEDKDAEEVWSWGMYQNNDEIDSGFEHPREDKLHVRCVADK